MCIYICVVTWVLLYDLGQPVLFVESSGGVHVILHDFIQTQLLLKATVDPETHKKKQNRNQLSIRLSDTDVNLCLC